MNPIEYWYRTNISLKTFLDNYFKDNIDRLDQFPELKTDCENYILIIHVLKEMQS